MTLADAELATDMADKGMLLGLGQKKKMNATFGRRKVGMVAERTLDVVGVVEFYKFFYE